MVGSDFCPDSNGLFLEMNLETGCWKLVVNCRALTKGKTELFIFFPLSEEKVDTKQWRMLLHRSPN